MADAQPEVVIIGGGFGGLACAQALRRAPVRVTLIDRRNFHLFQPLLYQVATGGLSPANISAPLRAILKNQANARVLMTDAQELDLPGRKVLTPNGPIPYDFLVVAAGARHAYFGKPHWEALAPGLKTVEDATEIRRRVLGQFELAELTDDEAEQRRHLTFIVVGAGPTGVEMAGAISELAHHTLRHNFRRIDPGQARVLLIEGGPRVLPPFHPKLSDWAQRSLERIGVEVVLNAMVTDIRPDGVTVKRGENLDEIACGAVVWAAGVEASPLARQLGEATGAKVDRAGRVAVEPDLSLPGHAEVFALGDMVAIAGPDGKPVPGVAPAAIQMGQHVARAITDRLRGQSPGPFRYYDKGSMATIGRNSAVAESMGLRMTGYLAWMAWLFIHILYLIEFQNRVLVMWQWFWNYLTRNRSARLITTSFDPKMPATNATK
jgi:NADH dehydrogenase